MKIVHIITRLILGGAQENTLITCKLLAERGHDVTLITGPAIGPEGELFEQTKNQKYNVIIVSKMIRAICPFYDSISYYQIKPSSPGNNSTESFRVCCYFRGYQRLFIK